MFGYPVSAGNNGTIKSEKVAVNVMKDIYKSVDRTWGKHRDSSAPWGQWKKDANPMSEVASREVIILTVHGEKSQERTTSQEPL